MLVTLGTITVQTSLWISWKNFFYFLPHFQCEEVQGREKGLSYIMYFLWKKKSVVYMIQFSSIILLIARKDNLKGQFVPPVLDGQDNNAAES